MMNFFFTQDFSKGGRGRGGSGVFLEIVYPSLTKDRLGSLIYGPSDIGWVSIKFAERAKRAEPALFIYHAFIIGLC